MGRVLSVKQSERRFLSVSLDIEDQYDKIYRYCYAKVHRRETAEDITQETFLRFFESYGYVNTAQALPCLYTIARHLCIDEYRRQKPELLEQEPEVLDAEEDITTRIAVNTALSALAEADRELLLLRYVNEVPLSLIGKIYGISRFAVYRRLKQATENLKEKLGKEGFS